MKEAEILQRRLTEFANNSYYSQTKQLHDLLGLIELIASPEAVEYLTADSNLQVGQDGHSSVIEEVMRKALLTRFITGKRSSIRPWDGATAVILNNKGQLRTGFSIPGGRVYQEYTLGELYAGALKKAVLSLYLHQAGRENGLEKGENLVFLRQLPDSRGRRATLNLFRGEVQLPIIGQTRKVVTEAEEKTIIETTTAFIGVSGCTFRRPYLQKLELDRLPKNYDINKLAGLSERTYGEKLRAHLLDPGEPLLIDEPGVIKLHRASN